MAAEPQVDPHAYIYNGTYISNTNDELKERLERLEKIVYGS